MKRKLKPYEIDTHKFARKLILESLMEYIDKNNREIGGVRGTMWEQRARLENRYARKAIKILRNTLMKEKIK